MTKKWNNKVATPTKKIQRQVYFGQNEVRNINNVNRNLQKNMINK